MISLDTESNFHQFSRWSAKAATQLYLRCLSPCGMKLHNELPCEKVVVGREKHSEDANLTGRNTAGPQVKHLQHPDTFPINWYHNNIHFYHKEYRIIYILAVFHNILLINMDNHGYHIISFWVHRSFLSVLSQPTWQLRHLNVSAVPLVWRWALARANTVPARGIDIGWLTQMLHV